MSYYHDNFTPREAAGSIAIDALQDALREIDRVMVDEPESYKRKASEQIRKLIVNLANKYHLDTVVPS